jgi:hypothetical protein
VNDDFHDRFVIPDSGPVRQIGTSLNGVSKRLSVMVTMEDDAAAAAIKAAFEASWATATPIEAPAEAPPKDAETKEEAKSAPEGAEVEEPAPPATNGGGAE